MKWKWMDGRGVGVSMDIQYVAALILNWTNKSKYNNVKINFLAMINPHKCLFFRKIFGPHVCGDALDILPSNRNILTGSWRKNNTLQIWDYNTGKQLKDIAVDETYSSMVSARSCTTPVTQSCFLHLDNWCSMPHLQLHVCFRFQSAQPHRLATSWTLLNAGKIGKPKQSARKKESTKC